MNLDPLAVLREALQAVPALKYALGVAGLAAVAAIVKAFGLKPKVAVGGAVVTLVLMVALVVFANLTTAAPQHFLLPVLVLMWSFLALTIAAAALLFSSAFFRWPVSLAGISSGKRPKGPSLSPRAQTRELIAEAALRRSLGEYESAWSLLNSSETRASPSRELLAEQTQIALDWLRKGTVEEPRTWKGLVDELLPCLLKGVAQAKGQQAADIYAHIGECYYIKFGSTHPRPEVEQYYQRALEKDPDNVYAHAMWGHWIILRDGEIAEANKHFAHALKSGRERPYVRTTQFSAMQSRWNDPATAVESIRIGNDMRLSGETLEPSERHHLARWIYCTRSKDVLAQLSTILPAREHIATLLWFSGDDFDDDLKFFLARLHEDTGDWMKAFSIYLCLRNANHYLTQEVPRALARCRQHFPQGKTEAQVVVEFTRDTDPVVRERALIYLSNLGVAHEEILPALLVAARDPVESVSRSAFEALEKIGAPAVPGVIELLKTQDQNLLIRAADILGKIATNSSAAASALIGLLHSDRREIREAGILALGQIGPASAPAVEPLISLLQQHDQSEDRIITALGEIGPPAVAAAPILSETLNRYYKENVVPGVGDNGGTAYSIALALKGIGHGPDAVPVLTAILKDAHFYMVRSRAAAALGDLGADAKAALPALIECLRLEYVEDQKDAASALSKIAKDLAGQRDQQCLPALRKALRDLQEGRFEARLIAPVRDAVELLGAG